MQSKVRGAQVEISQDSVLILDGPDIYLEALKLEGALVIKSTENAKVSGRLGAILPHSGRFLQVCQVKLKQVVWRHHVLTSNGKSGWGKLSDCLTCPKKAEDDDQALVSCPSKWEGLRNAGPGLAQFHSRAHHCAHAAVMAALLHTRHAVTSNLSIIEME